MEMTLKMGAFEALDENEMLAVDGGASQYAYDTVSTNCNMIGTAASTAIGYCIGGPLGGILGFCVSEYVSKKLNNKITSRW